MIGNKVVWDDEINNTFIHVHLGSLYRASWWNFTKWKKYIRKVNINLSKCLSSSAPPKACFYHRIRQEVLELLKALSPYYLLHRSPHSGAGIGLRRCGVWIVFIETNNGHRKMLVLWSEKMEWADYCLLPLFLQISDKMMGTLEI
jgi:hypothetical protein